MDQLLGQKDIKRLFENFIKQKKVPHMILHGNSGTGKTTSVDLLMNEIYNQGYHKSCILKLNGSDERGIDTIRGTVEQFCKKRLPEIYWGLNKMIIFDEADALTNDSQTALKVIIEQYSDSVTFCFMCNYADSIIQPLKSRCIVLMFNKLDDETIHQIILNEMNEMNQKYIDTITMLSNGDARKALGYAQMYMRDPKIEFEQLFGYNEESVHKLFQMTLDDDVEGLFNSIEKVSHQPFVVIYFHARKLLEQKNKNKEKPFIQLSQLICKTDVNLYQKGSRKLSLLNFMLKFKKIHN